MSTVDRVQTVVLTEMIRGVLTPGTWLRQDELAERLGVSKIPVREALQRLAALGLVRFETNRGAIVPALSADEARENFTLRRAIEPRLLEQAIERLTIVDLAEAELALTASPATYTETNWRFHRALYAPSQWGRGLAMTEILHAAVAPYVLLYLDDLGGAADSDAEHVGLLAACRDGDIGRATALLDRHLAHAESALLTFLQRPV